MDRGGIIRPVNKSTFSPHYAILRGKVRALRKAAGLSQRALAKRLRLPQTTIARIEQGERRLDLIEFYWICRALGADPIKVTGELLRECQALDRKRRSKKGQKRR